MVPGEGSTARDGMVLRPAHLAALCTVHCRSWSALWAAPRPSWSPLCAATMPSWSGSCRLNQRSCVPWPLAPQSSITTLSQLPTTPGRSVWNPARRGSCSCLSRTAAARCHKVSTTSLQPPLHRVTAENIAAAASCPPGLTAGHSTVFARRIRADGKAHCGVRGKIFFQHSEVESRAGKAAALLRPGQRQRHHRARTDLARAGKSRKDDAGNSVQSMSRLPRLNAHNPSCSGATALPDAFRVKPCPLLRVPCL